MGGRIFWILLTGAALVAGAALQGNMIFDWGNEREVSRAHEAAIEAKVQRSVEQRLDGVEVAGSDRRVVHAGREAKRELGYAIKRLVSAEAELAMLRIGDGADEDLREAQARSDAARAEVDRLKAAIDREEHLSTDERSAIRDEIRQQVRESIRSAVRG